MNSPHLLDKLLQPISIPPDGHDPGSCSERTTGRKESAACATAAIYHLKSRWQSGYLDQNTRHVPRRISVNNLFVPALRTMGAHGVIHDTRSLLSILMVTRITRHSDHEVLLTAQIKNLRKQLLLCCGQPEEERTGYNIEKPKLIAQKSIVDNVSWDTLQNDF